MSDAISKAIETMEIARSTVGPFSIAVTRKLTKAIEALQALQSGEPVVPEGYVIVSRAAATEVLRTSSNRGGAWEEIRAALLSAGKGGEQP
jgi:hypothetical protein